MADKPFAEMTDAELKNEFERWDREVREATSWGAALAQAGKWRDACERLLLERGLIDGKRRG